MTMANPLDPIDFPVNPVDGQTHTEGSQNYAYVAADDMWIGGPSATLYVLNKANAGFLATFYLGAFPNSAVPSKDNDGSALKDYQFYYNIDTATFMQYKTGVGWRGIVKPVPADSQFYVYTADGIKRSFTGVDVNGVAPKLDAANPEKVVVFNGSMLVESTALNVADYTVSHLTSTVTLTRVPRAGTSVVVQVLSADSSKTTIPDPEVLFIKNTATVSAAAGTTLSDKIAACVAPVLPKVGTTVIVGHDAAVGGDNTNEGIWYYNTDFRHVLTVGGGSGSSRIFSTTATVINNNKGIATTTQAVLNSQFKNIFSTVAKDGDWVVVPLEGGSNAHFCGLFYRSATNHDFHSAAPAWSDAYVQGFVTTNATKLNNLDIALKGIPAGSVQFVNDTAGKSILVATSAGTWEIMYSEAQVHTWATEASLWQSAVSKAELATLPPPAAGNKGQYWTWRGEPDTANPGKWIGGQVVDNTFPRISPNLDLSVLQIGDWLQSDGVKWVHIPADLLNKNRWDALGAFKTFAPNGTHEVSTIVKYKPTAGALGTWHYYKANANILTTDGDPATSAKWDDITPAVAPQELENVEKKTVLEDKDIVIYNTTKGTWEVKPLPPSGIRTWNTVDKYIADEVVLRQNLSPTDTWTAGTNPKLFRALSNTADNINKDPADVANAAFWEDLIYMQFSDLTDIALNTVTDGQVFAFNGTQWTNASINGLLQWQDIDYAPASLVYNKGLLFVANQTIVTGDAEPAKGNAKWDVINPIATLEEIPDVNLTTPVGQNEVLIQDTISNSWINSVINTLLEWSDKAYPVKSLVLSTENRIWYSTRPVVVGDDAPLVANKSNANFAWEEVDVHYTPVAWNATLAPVQANDLVLRKPLGGADTYTGAPQLFISLVNNNVGTDPLTDLVNWAAIGTSELSNLIDVDITTTAPADKDVLSWSAADGAWIPAKKGASSFALYSSTSTYKNGAYVEYGNRIHRADDDIPAGLTPDKVIPPPTTITTKAQTGTINPAVLSTIAGASSDAATVGSVRKVDFGLAPYTPVTAGVFAGFVPTEQYYYLTLVDKAEVYGVQGWDLRGSNGNQPLPTTIDVYQNGISVNPWTALDKADIQTLSEIGNVTELTNSQAGNILVTDGTGNWAEQPNPSYSKVETDAKMDAVVQGLARGSAVRSYTSTPPPAPAAFDRYIVKPTGTGLWAGEDNQLAVWDGTQWDFLAPKPNATHLVEDIAETWHWNGTAWVKVASSGGGGGSSSPADLWMVGDLKESVLTEAQFKNQLTPVEQLKWALADGRDVTGSAYATLTGQSKIPDLRGAFLRMAGRNNAHSGWDGGNLNSFNEDTTRRPRTNFTGTTNSAGSHSHTIKTTADESSRGYIAGGAGNWSSDVAGANSMYPAGNHSHNVTINGGGDGETKPKNYTVNYFIKIN